MAPPWFSAPGGTENPTTGSDHQQPFRQDGLQTQYESGTENEYGGSFTTFKGFWFTKKLLYASFVNRVIGGRYDWTQVKGKAQQQWGKLTNDDLDVIEGRREEFVGKVQERYGIAKEEAEKQVDDFCKKCN